MKFTRLAQKIISVLLSVAFLTAVCACEPKGSGGTQSSAKITLSAYEKTLTVGETFTLTVSADDNQAITFVSTDERVATVNSSGLVTAINKGVAEIFVVAGALTETCRVTVNEKTAERLSLSQTSATVRQGESVTVTASPTDGSGVTWLSSDESVATVSGGTIKGVSIGTAIIYAWSKSQTNQCAVTVVDQSYTGKDGYTLIWSDEFDGSALDMTKWSYMLGTQDHYGDSYGPMFWGNNEQQYYTQDAVSVSDGTLKITAKRENMPDGRNYSSARICTRDKGYWTYGYFEARIKLPTIEGMWPAFWMLPQPSSSTGTANEYGYWAACGEIDIMEAKGRLPYKVDTTLHFGNYGSSTYRTAVTTVERPISEWHAYALKWKTDRISWYIDGKLVLSLDSKIWWSAAAPTSDTAPFDVDFYILLNLAVGGNFDDGREPDENFVSADMEVDYVRVYSAN